jgi:anti-sigma factor RsiW
MNQPAISEDSLHAYVDAALPPAERTVVEAWLAENPEARARAQAYAEQKQALRALFDPILDEPLPVKLQQAAAAGRPAPSRWPLRLAAGVATLACGVLLGWVAHGQYGTESVAPLASLPHHAAVAHAVFSPDVRRPVEISAAQEDQLVTWLSKRLGTPVRAPKLGAVGYELVGGRLLPGNSGPVAQFMYQDASGQRLTLYVSTENATNRDTAFRFAREGQINVFYWIDGKFGYALSASIAKAELARVATAVYEQLESR